MASAVQCKGRAWEQWTKGSPLAHGCCFYYCQSVSSVVFCDPLGSTSPSPSGRDCITSTTITVQNACRTRTGVVHSPPWCKHYYRSGCSGFVAVVGNSMHLLVYLCHMVCSCFSGVSALHATKVALRLQLHSGWQHAVALTPGGCVLTACHKEPPQATKRRACAAVVLQRCV